MIGKKFFSIVALGGTAMSVVESVGSFAQENLPDYGFLFECLDKGCTYRPTELYGVDKTLQNLVTHFHLNRQETEKLLGYIRSFLEKYKNTDLNVPDIYSELWYEAFHEKGDGRIGFGAKRRGDGFDFFIVKAAEGGIKFCPGYDWSFKQDHIDKILNTDLNSIKFWPTSSFFRFLKRSDLPYIIFLSIVCLFCFLIALAGIVYLVNDKDPRHMVRDDLALQGGGAYNVSLSHRSTMASDNPYDDNDDDENQAYPQYQEMILVEPQEDYQ